MIKLIDLLNEVVPPKNTWFPLHPEEVKDIEDDIIDPELTKKLWSVNGNHAEYDEVEGMGHRTPLDVFINMYNKHA